MSEYTWKLLFTFVSIPVNFLSSTPSFSKLHNINLYKRQKTAFIFLFQIPWCTVITPSKQIMTKHKRNRHDNEDRSV